MHGARGPGAGLTGSKFLSGFCQRWPGGHLQQSCKVYPSPPRRRKWLSSRMRPVRAGEPSKAHAPDGENGQHLKDRGTSTLWRCRPSSTLWETSFLIWGPGWFAWCVTTQWLWLNKERGGHEIAHFDAADHTTVEVVRPQGDYVGSRPSARSAQHPGGFPVQSRPDTDHRLDDGHGASSTRVCHVAWAAGRLVCDFCQQTSHQVCIAVSGPQGRVDRCHVHALGQREGPPVRVPAIQDGPSSSAEDRSVTRGQDDFDRSTATGSIVVSGVDGSVPRRSDPTVRRGSRPADSRRLDRRWGDRDSSLPDVKSTRVETLWAILRAKGHSKEAANMMSRCLWESSLQVYESHWSRFVAFCRTKRWHVFRVRSQNHFSTYMMHFFRDGLLPSTIISRLWLLCYVIGCTIQQLTRTSSYWSELSGWNVRCNAESCLSGTFIWCCYHYWDRHSHPTVMKAGNPWMTPFP